MRQLQAHLRVATTRCHADARTEGAAVEARLYQRLDCKRAKILVEHERASHERIGDPTSRARSVIDVATDQGSAERFVRFDHPIGPTAREPRPLVAPIGGDDCCARSANVTAEPQRNGVSRRTQAERISTYRLIVNRNPGDRLAVRIRIDRQREPG